MEEFKGYVTDIRFRNTENLYTVFEINMNGETLTCVGYPADISVGECCEVSGDYTEHRVYGKQLKVQSYRRVAPEGAQAVFRYLSSGAIKGIGAGLAKRIVDRFGDDTMRIIDEEPERLSEVRGISERGAREIAARAAEKREVRDAIIFLQGYGITNRQAIRIWNAYGMDMYSVLEENPYRLAEDIQGIGFARADEIARKAGVSVDSDFRIRSGILYVLSEALAAGSSYLPKELLIRKTAELLEVPEEPIDIQVDNLAIDNRLKIRISREEICVYSRTAYETELQIAKRLLDLDSYPVDSYSEEEILNRIGHIERNENITLDELQREAVYNAVTRGIVLISGGPGTGKTTAINTIIRFFISDVKSVVLAAPTGRAAKRMSEASGYEAMTIHRLLGYKAIPGVDDSDYRMQFEKDSDDPLDADAIIIDEMSMVDLFLFNALLKAVRQGTRLILVGDINQLPSVGPGRILKDMISSGAFKTVILQKIFRQAAESDIVMNAHRILSGETLLMNNKSRDFFFLEREDANIIYKHIILLLRDKLPGYVGCESGDIQVLTPMKKGPLGCIKLNEVIQSVLNPKDPSKAEYTAHDVTFRVGDKVMQTRNNYQIEWKVPGNFKMAIDSGTGIFNGDFGIILEIDTRLSQMIIRFDDNRVVEYPFQELDDLEPAYAITVHKSQGSEYPAVILPILSGPQNLFNRNLLYTAITRAKKTVMILGSRQTVENMISNTHESSRYTGLCSRIHEVFHIPENPEENN